MEDWLEREREAVRIDKMYEDVEDAVIALIIAAYASGIPQRVYESGEAAKQLLSEAYQQTKVWNQEAVTYLYGEQNQLSADTLSAIIQSSDARFSAMTNTAIRRIDELVASFRVADARRRALSELTRGRMPIPPAKLAQEMEEGLRAAGITGFTDASGRRWKLRTYAEMAARTTVMEAQLAGVKDRVIAAGQDLVNVIGPLDYPDGCPPAVLSGPYSLTGATKEYGGRPIMTVSEMVSYYGIFHPRCRHSLAGAAASDVAARIL